MQDQYRLLLLKLGAFSTPHSGRTLFDHLKGVHDLLRDWGNDEHVCAAGAFHSIYGNEVFTHRSTDDRKLIASTIGAHAELLVHYFCTKTRPLFEDVNDQGLREELIEIEMANIFEQNKNSSKLRKFPRKALSNGARMALQGSFG